MSKIDWEAFWAQYRNIESKEEKDLYYQVGKTINEQPIVAEAFNQMIENIVQTLSLNENDVLLELCCGNGLLTKPLSDFIKYVYAFDFSEHLVETAIKFKQKENIFYTKGDAKSDFFNLFEFQELPNKFLMNDSLAYFSPNDLRKIIENISNRNTFFSFYITCIPNDALKWNFYNTPERKQKYLTGLENGDEINNGLGRWWKENEFLEIGESLNLNVVLTNQYDSVSNYRINVLFEKK
jgi:SAM-dependent methyltransferase